MRIASVTRGCGTALVACGLLASAPAGAPQQPPLFSAHTDLVVLHVAVTHGRGEFVARLAADAFTIYDEGVRQPIEMFSSEDVPATVGLLIDDSASMFGLRDQVTAAATAFADTSNPSDEIFALTFNERVQAVLPPEVAFTSNAALLRTHLRNAIAARGRTALYDAVGEGLRRVADGGHARKVLVILSDGGDNASTSTLAAMQEAAATANATIYTVALADPASHDARIGLLADLARVSGGVVYRPHQPADLLEVFARIARDIRERYTVAFTPSGGARGVRHVRVEVRGAGGEVLPARTRTEYVTR